MGRLLARRHEQEKLLGAAQDHHRRGDADIGPVEILVLVELGNDELPEKAAVFFIRFSLRGAEPERLSIRTLPNRGLKFNWRIAI